MKKRSPSLVGSLLLLSILLGWLGCGGGGGETGGVNSVPSSTSISLVWDPPTTNSDGSTLTDLAGFKVYYGTASGTYTDVVDVPDPAATAYTLDNLQPGTYFLVVSAYGSYGNESDYSNEVSKTLSP